jgi:hypothetical protein
VFHVVGSMRRLTQTPKIGPYESRET